MKIPPQVEPVLQKLKGLAAVEDYIGAFIYGSVAKGIFKLGSDVDAQVVVKDGSCPNINTPVIDGVVIDLSFVSLADVERTVARQLDERKIMPQIAEAVIIFDKTGNLNKLKTEVIHKNPQPKKYNPDGYHMVKYHLYDIDQKVRRNLELDPETALVIMHASLADLVSLYYKISGQWRVNDKNLLTDLDRWDLNLSKLLRNYVTISTVKSKFKFWTEIIDHIADPLGGRLKVEENTHDCDICRKGIADLLAD